MSQTTALEVDAAVFAAYPRTDAELRTDGHEPGVGVAVGRSGLAAEIGVAEERASVVGGGERGGGAARIMRTGHEHLLHEVCALHGDDLRGLAVVGIDFVAVFVYDACDHDGIVVPAVVCNHAIGVEQFGQLHVAGAQSQ